MMGPAPRKATKIKEKRNNKAVGCPHCGLNAMQQILLSKPPQAKKILAAA
jgi:hypothetical protein